MNKLYTAVGHIQFKGKNNGVKCPIVLLNKKEYILDIQEMMLWAILNWRILSKEEIDTCYKRQAEETGYMTHRTVDECISRLVQRGLIAEGSGETPADSLYDLLSGLYVVPISENPFLRLISFIRLTIFEGVPYRTTKRIFGKDQRNDSERKIMHLVNQATLSTAEIIKCAELNVFDCPTENILMDTLYHDEYTTSENIIHSVRFFSQCRPILTSVTNLYLRKQIIFERM